MAGCAEPFLNCPSDKDEEVFEAAASGQSPMPARKETDESVVVFHVSAIERMVVTFGALQPSVLESIQQ
jgi:hypothetical protein